MKSHTPQLRKEVFGGSLKQIVMAIIRLPKGAKAEVNVTLAERQTVQAVQKLAAVAAQKLTLTADR